MTSPSRIRAAKFPATSSEGAQSEIEESVEPPAGPKFTPRDASLYIVSMTTELQKISRAAEFRFLTYLLEMSFQEAFRLSIVLDPERQPVDEGTPGVNSDPRAAGG